MFRFKRFDGGALGLLMDEGIGRLEAGLLPDIRDLIACGTKASATDRVEGGAG